MYEVCISLITESIKARWKMVCLGKRSFDFIELVYEYPLYYPPPKSENYFLYPVLIAEKMGMKTTIFTLRTPQTPLKKQVIDDIHVFRFGSIFSLLRQLIKASPELVHCHSFGWVPANLTPLFVRRCVLTAHLNNLDIYPEWKVALALFPLRKLRALIARTEFEAKLFKSRVDESKVHVIPLAIDYDFFSRSREEKDREIRDKYEIDAEDRIILSVANLRPIKNLKTLVRSFALVKAKISSSKLIIVGGEPASNLSILYPTRPKSSYYLELIELANALDIRNDVVFVGYQNAEELRKFYSASEVFCMPSIFEGQLLAAGEAASAGLPLVLSNLENLIETYQGCALFHDPMDYEQLAAHIIDILENPELVKALGNCGRARMQNYRPTIIYGKLKKLYENLLSYPHACTHHR